MTRARRLASVAVVASLAVGGLSACRSEPSVAAYVGGDTRITEARVDSVWDEVRTAVAAAAKQAGQAGQAATVPISRADVVRALVGDSVLSQVARDQKLTVPGDLSLSEYANQLRLPASTEYVRLYAESDTIVRLLRTNAKNAPEPSDEDLKQVYDVLVANQGIEPGTTFDAFKTQLPAENKQLVQSSAAVQKQIEQATGSMDITVNPRYQPLAIPVLEFQTQNGELRPLVVAPLGESADDSPVLNAS